MIDKPISTEQLIGHDYRQAYQRMFHQILSQAPPGQYDEAALPSYTHGNRLMSWLFWNRIATALQMLDLQHQTSTTILDFGCGGGVTFKALQQLGWRIIGCDNEQQELARSSAAAFQVEVRIVSDLNEVVESSVDALLALDVLEHIEQLEDVVTQLRHVSRPGATWVISGPTENLLYKAGRWMAGFSGHYHCRNIYQIEKLLVQQGLQRQQAKTLYWQTPLFRVSRWVCQ